MAWDVSNYSTTPGLNGSINGIDISEGSSADGYNDALRQIMADIATWTAAHAVTYPIAIANGGTGQTSAAAALAALGGLSSDYRGLPQIVKSASFGFDPAFNLPGGHTRWTGNTGSGTFNPSNNYATGDSHVIINDGTGVLSIIPDTGVTLIWAASGASGTRSLAVGGVASVICVALNRYFISGTGLS